MIKIISGFVLGGILVGGSVWFYFIQNPIIEKVECIEIICTDCLECIECEECSPLVKDVKDISNKIQSCLSNGGLPDYWIDFNDCKGGY